MALIHCPECGKEISDKSGVCIHCGYKINSKSKNNILKYKVPVFIIALVAIVSISLIYITNKVPDGFSKDVYKAGKAYIKIADDYIHNGGDIDERLTIPEYVDEVFTNVADAHSLSDNYYLNKDDELVLSYLHSYAKYAGYICEKNTLDDFEESVNDMKELMELR